MARDVSSLLKTLGKKFYTMPDLERIFGLDRRSLRVTLNRLEKRKAIKRIFKGIYQLPDQPTDVEAIATQLYRPAYLSFESALAGSGILSQIPYTVMVATTKKPKRLTIANRTVEYRQLKKDLFFGFQLEGDVYVAWPEKALLDQLYLVSKGQAGLDFNELDLKGLSMGRFLDWAKKFPKPTQRLARELSQRSDWEADQRA